jgi:hypothetical protein
MKYKLSVFGAFAAVILGLEYLFDVPTVAMGTDPFLLRLLVALLLAGGLSFFWFQFRPQRSK